jgi:uncharacterized YigZ family protein
MAKTVDSSFLVPISLSEIEYLVKRSRFIAFAAHTKGTESAKSFLHELQVRFPDARHHCYGFIAGSPNNSNLYGFSDDNEPSGTAGMPIFTQLKHSGIGEICVVVVRYFGGTKLGTGGLARAYSEATKQVLAKLKTNIYVETKTVILNCDFALEAVARNEVSALKGSIIKVEYSEGVKLTCLIPVNCKLKLPYSVNISASSSA